MPTTAKGLRFPSGSDSPNVAQYIQNLATDVNNYIYTGPRFATFQRALGTGSDSYASAAFTVLIVGTWTAAPAGDYLIHSTMLIAGSADIGGNLEVRVNGAVISQPNHRADVTPVATTLTNVHSYTHAAAGDLAIDVRHSVSTGSATIYNASSKAVVQYLGRRV